MADFGIADEPDYEQRQNNSLYDERSDINYERRRHRERDETRDGGGRRSRRRSRSKSRSREKQSRRDRGDREEKGREFGDRNRDRESRIDEHYGHEFDGAYRPAYRNEDSEFGSVDSRSRRSEDCGSHHDGYSDRSRSSNDQIRGRDWRSKLTSIRDAHFDRNKQTSAVAQNQFKNDGSFLEMFKKQMAGGTSDQPAVTPNSLVLASSSIPFSPGLSLPPLTAEPIEVSKLTVDEDEDLDGVPMTTGKRLPMPVPVGKRRLAKPLKTGIVIKKPQKPAEDEADQEKLDAWARYLQEVQKYKSTNCMEEDQSRPLVK